MKTKIQKIKTFIRTHYIISSIIGLVVIFLGFKIFGGSTGGSNDVVVKIGDVIQKVIVNGKSKPVSAVELGFETGGKVVWSGASIGDRVLVGQTLASLSSAEASADLLRAQANLESEQAKLDEIKSGARPEEVNIAEQDVLNAQNTVASKILDGYTKSDDAIHKSIDRVFTNPRSTSPQLILTGIDPQLKINIESDRPKIETLLFSWSSKTDDISESGITLALSNLSEIKKFADKIASAVNSQNANSNISQTTLDDYKSAVSTGRENVSTAINSMTTASGALFSAQRELFLKQSGGTPEAIHAQEAKVMQYQADVKSFEAKLAKMSLHSPINGIVTKQNAKVGEIVTPGKPLVSVISDSDLEIESNVSEISIGKVSVGNPVTLSFDAFPGETFEGIVKYIEPAETLVDGVVNYKVTVAFAKKYPQMKSGLTSRLEIITAKRASVLNLPQYVISKTDEGSFVIKKTESGTAKVWVQTGLVGQDGSVEITAISIPVGELSYGLSEGDIVQSAVVQN